MAVAMLVKLVYCHLCPIYHLPLLIFLSLPFSSSFLTLSVCSSLWLVTFPMGSLISISLRPLDPLTPPLEARKKTTLEGLSCHYMFSLLCVFVLLISSSFPLPLPPSPTFLSSVSPSLSSFLSLSPLPLSLPLPLVPTYYSSVLNGEEVSGQDYAGCLRELVNICVLCNDSELAYNEVSTVNDVMMVVSMM